MSARAEAIAPTLALFNAAKAKGVAVFFITGRRDEREERTATETNLRGAGYDGWAALVMRPPGTSASAQTYKTIARATIAAQGFTIIASETRKAISPAATPNARSAYRIRSISFHEWSTRECRSRSSAGA